MGSVLRKSYTKPVPPGAEIITRKGERLARWRDSRGKVRTAPLTTGQDGTTRIRAESGTFFARYRDGNGIVVEEPTGCRSEDAARQVLAELERKAERVRSGLLSPAEARASEHLGKPIGEHVADYLTSLEAAGSCPKHVAETRRVLNRLLAGCGFGSLAALERSAVENWLNQRRKGGASARTRNIDLTRLIAFANWCVTNGRLLVNHFRGIPKANEAETRRRRRAMTEDELVRLLEVARSRPLLEALTVRKGGRKGERYANVRPEVRRRLDDLGRERALIYKTLVLTGLRRGELASLTIGQLRLDNATPHVLLEAADEKNRQGSGIVIRPDLAEDLQAWIDGRLAGRQAEARSHGEPIPARLPADALLFNVADKMIRVFDRDLKAAGIAKRDERGYSLDVHALRHTFGTLLSKGGVPLRTAQAAMRHADPSLTANVYTDPKLLDVAGALDALPTLRLDGPSEFISARATGTRPIASPPLAPPLALPPCKPGQSATTNDKTKAEPPNSIGEARLVVSPVIVKSSVGLASPDNQASEWAMQDLNLRPPACRATRFRQLSSSQLPAGQGLRCIISGGSIGCKASHGVAWKCMAAQ